MMKRLLATVVAFGVVVGSAIAAHHKDTLVHVASKDDRFTTLVKAVKAADLADTLKSKGPFTVFAPTNQAFSKLPDGTVETLLKPENKDKLRAVLTYHVVPKKVMSADLSGTTMAETVNGKKLEISAEYGEVTANNANVVATDIEADNGVIHVVDSVVLPPES